MVFLSKNKVFICVRLLLFCIIVFTYIELSFAWSGFLQFPLSWNGFKSVLETTVLKVMHKHEFEVSEQC